VLPIRAGKEVSVAATKSYLATLSAMVHLISVWSKNNELYSSLKRLPAVMKEVIAKDIQLLPADFEQIKNMVVLSRGISLGIANEMALKLKEVCSIHAEAFSSAEFLHGPITLVDKGIHILNCVVKDECEASHSQQIHEIIKRNGRVIFIGQAGLEIHPRLAPLLILQRFYIDIANISVALGLNPDKPTGLKKVTQTT
jgi:glucosamine--fructose-6-phosphate aminotransferase (isomerizing)